MSAWGTSCPDWRERIERRESLIPFPPLFPEEAASALEVFKEFRVVDVQGAPTVGEIARPWIIDFATAFFGSYDPESGRRLIRSFYLKVPKKNWKALALDTPIPTPHGWTTMGELRVGDKVFGIDGAAYSVVGESPVYTKSECYEVTFSNGERVIADAGHQWVTYSLRDEKTGVRTTREIAASCSSRADGARNHSMRMPAPIAGAEVPLPVPPYALGAWLGDGTSKNADITSADPQIVEEIGREGIPVKVYPWGARGAAQTYGLTNGDRSQAARDVSFMARLRSAGVLRNKHIPPAYLRASHSQRLSLLQGLMDTDGHINSSGTVLTFTSTLERLARDVCELVATFGLKFSLTERPMTCNGKPVPGLSWTVQFCAFRDVPVFRLRRKLGRMRAPAGSASRSRTVQIVSVQSVPSRPVKCIAVDAPDHQFLFGRTMLPTHNSGIASFLMGTLLIRNWRESGEFGIIAPTTEVANNAFGPLKHAIRKDEELSDLLHIQDHIRTITHRNTQATLQVVAAESDTVSGKKFTVTLVEELWQFGKRPNAESMLLEATGGMASREEGAVIYLTTESDEQPAGVYKAKNLYARKVRDGEIVDPTFLPVMYEWPEKMVESKACLELENAWMVNPNLGASVKPDYLYSKHGEARLESEKAFQAFCAKHLNVEIGMALGSDRWPGADYWQRQGAKITFDDLLRRSEVIVAGGDGGGLDDLLGLGLFGRDRETKHWLHWGHAWANSIVLERRKEIAPRLLDFQRAGDLTIYDAPGRDIAEFADIICKVRDAGLLPEKNSIGLDAAGIRDLIDVLVARGFVVGEHITGISQGYRLQGAILAVERKLAGGELEHGSSEMMAWCVGNAKVEQKGNAIIITKQISGKSKIDPLMALFDAGWLMSMNPEAKDTKPQLLFV